MVRHQWPVVKKQNPREFSVLLWSLTTDYWLLT